jgi:Domain of unknown function DUF11
MVRVSVDRAFGVGGRGDLSGRGYARRPFVAFKIRVFNNGSKVLTSSNALDSLAGHRLRVLSVRTTNGRCRTRVLARSTRVSCSARTLATDQAITINVAAQATTPGTSSDTATLPGVSRDRTPDDTTRRRA